MTISDLYGSISPRQLRMYLQRNFTSIGQFGVLLPNVVTLRGWKKFQAKIQWSCASACRPTTLVGIPSEAKLLIRSTQRTHRTQPFVNLTRSLFRWPVLSSCWPFSSIKLMFNHGNWDSCAGFSLIFIPQLANMFYYIFPKGHSEMMGFSHFPFYATIVFHHLRQCFAIVAAANQTVWWPESAFDMRYPYVTRKVLLHPLLKNIHSKIKPFVNSQRFVFGQIQMQRIKKGSHVSYIQ